jgi:hypothetical protein
MECHEFSDEDETDLMQLYRDALSGVGHEVDDFIDSVDAYSRFQEVQCPNFRRKDGRDVMSSNSKYTEGG